MSVIAFIGLGAMGGPMAANLVRGGNTVRGFDLSKEARAEGAANGIEIHDTAAEAVEGSEVVVTMLPNGAILDDLMLSKDGLLPFIQPGTILIDSSSIDVATSKKLHAAAESASLHCLDAPVSGGIAGAMAGSLTFMVGGNAETLDRARPVLEAMGHTVIHVGGPGSGQAAKTCNQMLFGTTLTAVSEMFVLATALGLNHQTLWNIVTKSTGDCRAIRNFCPVPGVVPDSAADKDFKPGFAAPLMLKDLNLALTAADAVGQRLALTETATAAYSTLVDQYGAIDCSAVIKTMSAQLEVSK